MFCKNCGIEIDSGAKFCSKCGGSVEHNEEPHESIAITRSKNINFGTMKNSNNRTTKIQIGSVIFIGVLALTWFFIIKPGSNAQIPNGTYALSEGVGIGYEELIIKGDEVSVNLFGSLGAGAEMLMTFKYKIDGDRLTMSEVKDGFGITYTYEMNGNSITLNGSKYVKK